MLVTRLADHFGARWAVGPRCLQAAVRAAGRPIRLVLPETFMNSSGDAIAERLRYWRLDPGSLLVAHDDVDLPLGRFRFRTGGSAGGQKGVESVIDRIGEDFARLKLGVGRPPAPLTTEDWVLSRLTTDEQAVAREVIETAGEAVLVALESGLPEAMNRFHSLPDVTLDSAASDT